MKKVVEVMRTEKITQRHCRVRSGAGFLRLRSKLKSP